MLGTCPVLGAGTMALGWVAGVAYGAAIDRWHLPSRNEDTPLIALGVASLAVLTAAIQNRAIAEAVTVWPVTALHLAGAALAILLLTRAWHACRLEQVVAMMVPRDDACRREAGE